MRLHEVITLPYTHKQLFDLVLDVKSYPEFLPFCINSKILDSDEKDAFTAELTIKFGIAKEKYTSLITPQFTDKKATINVEAISGPFKHLINIWNFTPTNGGTIIEFSLDFEFKSLILQKMMGSMLEKAYTKMIEAFEKRAMNKYNIS